MSHLRFEFLAFPPIFVHLKLTCLVPLFDCKLQFFKNSPNWTIFDIFNDFFVNIAVEWDFFCDFQTPWVGTSIHKTCKSSQDFDLDSWRNIFPSNPRTRTPADFLRATVVLLVGTDNPEMDINSKINQIKKRI